jgi:hypothetical protein
MATGAARQPAGEHAGDGENAKKQLAQLEDDDERAATQAESEVSSWAENGSGSLPC